MNKDNLNQYLKSIKAEIKIINDVEKFCDSELEAYKLTQALQKAATLVNQALNELNK